MQRYQLRLCRVETQDFAVFCAGGLRYSAGGTLLDCRSIDHHGSDSNSVCGRLLDITPATRLHKAHSYAINNHEVNPLTGSDTQRDSRLSHREAMSEVPPVFSRIRNSIEDYVNGLDECKIYSDPSQKAKGEPLTDFQSES